MGIIPLKKTVRELIERPVIGEVRPEELRKKAEETVFSLSNWLEKQKKLGNILVCDENRRDPFIVPVTKKIKKSLPVEPPKLVLKGIAWDETEPLALINGLVVKEGNTVQRARIVKIDFDRVVVRYGSKKFVIKLIE